MGQFVGQHRLLLFRLNPVQQIHRLGLVVVKTRHLLRQQRDHERLQLEVAIQQPELLQHNLRPRQALRSLVFVELFAQIPGDLVARDQLALHAMHDG